ncbi:streptomycin biosynthesis protein StrI [Cubamyces sp. BRFM 1775]|nr:streptomycin biosynthesis protein StrI [Cubamyces sp. BRFM 1775]
MPHDFATLATEPVTIAIVGCGHRGRVYAAYALQEPTLCKVVAIAEPRLKARKTMSETYSIDKTLVFEAYKDLLKASADTLQTTGRRLADAVVITVQDHLHMEVALAFAAQGYHILCEKPMATTVEGCVQIEAAVKKAGIIFGVGHVLRYSPYNNAMMEVIRSGRLGPLINVVHIEPVGYWHFAHSYVRGNWARESESSFSLMTKSSHDIDILCHYLYTGAPTRVSSFGSLQHFRKERKPADAGEAKRCIDCAYERDCPYSAKRVYLDPVAEGRIDGRANVLVDGIPDIENITEALKTGPYGRCAYECDNDVCDNQVVNLEFSNGATASFTMVAHTKLICERQTRLHFAYGEIVGDMNTFTVTDYRTGESTKHAPKNEGGHGGGDLGLFSAFVEAVRTGRQEVLGMDVTEVLRSHLTVFAAEKSRRDGVVVDCEAFEKEARERFA